MNIRIEPKPKCPECDEVMGLKGESDESAPTASEMGKPLRQRYYYRVLFLEMKQVCRKKWVLPELEQDS